MDIAAWLRELGLERYEQAFRENEIDAEILAKLTADDLKDIGVTIVGHRRKLLEAIAALAEPALAPQAEPSASAEAKPKARPARAERRQLTVMFVDLVGSTELAARLDPEDMGEVVRRYQERCAELVARWGGHVAKYMGDGVLAYFGWPQAHEDDAERSVRAGLELAKEVGKLTTTDGAPLGARIGIATGLVLVGDLVGEGAAQEERVIGDTPHLAARLQALAAPGTVVIAPNTRRLLGSLFDLADLGSHNLKGFAKTIRAWQALGESRAEGRFAAMHQSKLAPLIGRGEELQLLLSRWQRAKEGDGQVVLLSGEAGIGKSRITQALAESAGQEPCTLLRYYCSPYHINSALHPVIEQLERAAGLQRGDPPELRLEKVEAMLTLGGASVEPAALLATMLSIPTGDRYPPTQLSPKQQKEKTFHLLIDQLQGLASSQPVLILFEDAHWIDPSTEELLHLLIPQIQRLPLLLVITFRPEFIPNWTGHTHITQLSLSRLSQRQATELIEGLTAGRTLPGEVLSQILIKTDGVPLFIEELTKMVLESGLLKEAGGRPALCGPWSPLSIPTTLHDSLLARLDRLAPVKEVAQTGAVIGREFSRELLSAVAQMPDEALESALDQLVASQLVFRRGDALDATYSFKHVLVRDAAYQSLLRSRRRQLHCRVAQILETQFPELVDAQPELLAWHYTGADLREQAICYWQRAGQHAVARSAHVEAIAHLAKGIELLNTLPDSGERQRRELHLQLKLGRASIACKGHGAPEVDRIYRRARALCKQVDEPDLLHRALMGLEAYYVVRADFKAARQIVEQSLYEAKRANHPVRLMDSHIQLGTVLFHLGEVEPALAHLRQGLELYDAQRCQLPQRLLDPGIIARYYEGWTLWHVGHPDRGWASCQEALEFTKKTAQPFNMAWASVHAALYLQHCRQASAVIELAEDTIKIAAEYGFATMLSYGKCLKAWAITTQDNGEEGIGALPKAIAAYRSTGAEILVPFWLALLAEGHRRAGLIDAGLLILKEAFAALDQSGERIWEAELQRLKGELILKRGDKKGAEALFRHALKSARRQQTRSWELRVATSLSRLWAEQGERERANDLLAPIYSSFTEGFDTVDLKDAKALLDELA